MREDAVALAKLRARGVRRAFLRRLVEAGFQTRDDLRAADPEALRAAVRNKAALAALTAALARKGPAAADDPGGALTSRAAEAETLPPEVSAAPVLSVDLPARRVVYRGIEIPTRPPHHLQRQPLLALTVLAERVGRPVTVAELAEEMQRVGGFVRRLIAPEARDLRYKVLAPFRHALRQAVPSEEIDRLVESIPGEALRLNVPGPVTVVSRLEHGGRQPATESDNKRRAWRPQETSGPAGSSGHVDRDA